MPTLRSSLSHSESDIVEPPTYLREDYSSAGLYGVWDPTKEWVTWGEFMKACFWGAFEELCWEFEAVEEMALRIRKGVSVKHGLRSADVAAKREFVNETSPTCLMYGVVAAKRRVAKTVIPTDCRCSADWELPVASNQSERIKGLTELPRLWRHCSCLNSRAGETSTHTDTHTYGYTGTSQKEKFTRHPLPFKNCQLQQTYLDSMQFVNYEAGYFQKPREH